MRTISIGAQGFEDIRRNGYYYVDKTDFIREWWESGDSVTLITRPRRFGKTLNMDMLNCFFSLKYKGRGEELFSGLAVWKDPGFGSLQGTFPVIHLSFADVKQTTFADARTSIIRSLQTSIRDWADVWKRDPEARADGYFFTELDVDSSDADVARAIQQLSQYLYSKFGRKTIILLDEYDAPLQEAYTDGYWDEMTGFIRAFFNATFKTNPSMERGLMTGITRVSKESIFSELNNLTVVSTTSLQYETAFGFTENEVFHSLDEYGLSNQKDNVRKWYDGFTFGSHTDIYNPWSITNFLKFRKFDTYWAGTSANRLVSDLIRKGSDDVKQTMQDLLNGGEYVTELDEQIIFSQLDHNETAIWSLLLASGYLKVKGLSVNKRTLQNIYHLVLTDFEVELMFEELIRDWFAGTDSGYNDFLKALLRDDVEAMNVYMNRIAEDTISSFDSGTGRREQDGSQPERFWHGFVLGLLVGLRNDEYRVKSNRESGFGRYDVMIIPQDKADLSRRARIIEFKVQKKDEKTLEETARTALAQIADRDYDHELIAGGFSEDRICHYGFAFSGKRVLIKKA